jgi:hypothetical protein
MRTQSTGYRARASILGVRLRFEPATNLREHALKLRNEYLDIIAIGLAKLPAISLERFDQLKRIPNAGDWPLRHCPLRPPGALMKLSLLTSKLSASMVQMD